MDDSDRSRNKGTILSGGDSDQVLFCMQQCDAWCKHRDNSATKVRLLVNKFSSDA
ncbi:hypothetical protein SESBI_21427 [Sesbania bispinosa]|nr:hypothetical protein SESBI_21427 [Sesbania bispinosa]